ncbi:MAG: DUF192 domain-containing protein [Verrucomicrobiaceae bacterium]|nr:MAG: DUF192 domain-containing protein [Verrucomicrobiaceae bacterium]
MTNRLVLTLLFGFLSPLLAIDTAQPELPTAALCVGKVAVRAEVADDDTERTTGLMFRESLPADSGMLFVMPSTGPAGFWMKNTLIPLSIAYIGPDGTILEIHDMQPKSEKAIRSTFPTISYALEMTQGWFAKNNIWPGEHVSGLPPLPRE